MKNVDERTQARADLIVDVVEDILIYMEDNKISKTELADKMEKSKSAITQLLNPYRARNMTLKTLSDICFALGTSPKIFISENDIITNEKIHAVQEKLNNDIQYLFKEIVNVKNHVAFNEKIREIKIGSAKPWNEKPQLKVVGIG